MIALGAMKALQECGYRIPQDISIIGFDDLPFCEIASPRLTSLRVPKQEMGQIAVRRIIEIIKNSSEIKTQTQVCTEFVERDSVGTITQA
jgi:LacI family transcriptional regulator